MATRQVLTDLDFASASRITNLPDGTQPQHPATVAQLEALKEGLAWKDNVRAASTANVTVSNPGTAAFDGITLANGDRLLLKDQTVPAENGIYVFNGSSTALTRAADVDTWDSLESAVVTVDEGTAAGGSTWRQTAVNGVIGTTSVAWSTFGATVPQATEAVAGKAEVATQAETDAGTDDLRIVTPLKLANAANRKLKFATNVGDGTATSITITHNLGTQDLSASIRRNSGNFDEVDAEVRFPTINTCTVLFSVAPTAAQFRVIISG